MKVKIIPLLCLAAIGFGSCLGVSADISIRADGSGTIALEYRVSQMLESVGRLDGNERWPAIPAGRADFERGLARIPGMRLKSFSSKNVRNSSGGSDLLTKAVLEFNNTAALLAFLDSAGSRASLTQENGQNLLRLDLLDGAPRAINADLVSLLREVSPGYGISVSLTAHNSAAPAEASLTVIPSSVQAARLEPRGKKVSFTIGIAELLEHDGALALEIRW